MGSKSLPWYLLGLSDASDMFDISGTMWMVTLCFIYGMKSIWIPWLWPVFNQVFLMMYLSKWLRRSNATTGAEWLATRFGQDRTVNASHISVVVFALLGCFGFLAYGFVGLGKFMEIFIPWSSVQPYIPFAVSPEYVPHIYGIVFTLFATFYSVIGGMQYVVEGPGPTASGRPEAPVFQVPNREATGCQVSCNRIELIPTVWHEPEAAM